MSDASPGQFRVALTCGLRGGWPASIRVDRLVFYSLFWYPILGEHRPHLDKPYTARYCSIGWAQTLQLRTTGLHVWSRQQDQSQVTGQTTGADPRFIRASYRSAVGEREIGLNAEPGKGFA